MVIASMEIAEPREISVTIEVLKMYLHAKYQIHSSTTLSQLKMEILNHFQTLVLDPSTITLDNVVLLRNWTMISTNEALHHHAMLGNVFRAHLDLNPHPTSAA
ncbi:MAG: hypothetical protein KR126chlam3_01715 [Chlamydiae bacterium]|nr:hypothetical protein [Chlamydiota bacterium]